MTSCLALIHAAAQEVRTGELDSKAALDVLSVTILDLFTGLGRADDRPRLTTRRQRQGGKHAPSRHG